MEFSLFYFANDDLTPGREKYRLVLDGTAFADQNGFSAIWTPERHFHPFGGQYPNPAVIGAAVAMSTARIQIRAGSVVLPLHNPLRVVEEWSVVDNLSDGRCAISFASGWAANDFVLAPDCYSQRHAIMYRDIDVVRALWRGEEVCLPNGHGQAIRVQTRPRPVQPELPIWLTAAGSVQTFERAGTMGANLLTHLLGQKWHALAPKIEAYRAARRRAGHATSGRVALMMHTFLHPDADCVEQVSRPPLGRYVRSSLQLTGGNTAVPATEQEIAPLVKAGVEKYLTSYGLFGKPEACLSRIRELSAIGVDEIACLIDFGIDCDTVLGSLPHLKRLSDLASLA